MLDAEGKPVLEDVTEDNPPNPYTRNFGSRTIYGITTSFSPFYLARKVNHRISPMFDQEQSHLSGSLIPVKLKLLNAEGTVNLSALNKVPTVRGLTLAQKTIAQRRSHS